jgi:transaldolase
MKFFLDSANVEHAKEIAKWGILEGITTNPTFVAKEMTTPLSSEEFLQKFKAMILAMCELAPSVSAEVIEDTVESMKKQALEISSWHKNVVVKIPMTSDGLQVVRFCSEQGIRTNVTLVFTVRQAVAAAKAGATYVSPFVGRIDDAGGNGIEFIRQVVATWDRYNFTTEILAASFRSIEHVEQTILAGADIATIKYEYFKDMLQNELTMKGLQKFMADYLAVVKQ